MIEARDNNLIRQFEFLFTGDFELELDEVSDACGDDIPGANWADAARSSSENHVAALKSKVFGDGGDESGNIEDHVASRSSLTILGIHLQPQLDVVGIRQRRLSNDKNANLGMNIE